ncbi:MAG: DUF5696 domain-containing protein [Oscillospiraceae bacterium]
MEKTVSVNHAGVELRLNTETLALSVSVGGTTWNSDLQFAPRVKTGGGDVPFSATEECEHLLWQTGVGRGIHSIYRRIPGLGGLEFETIIWVESATGNVLFSWIPTREAVNVKIEKVHYPAPFVLDGGDDYTVLPFLQGVLLPNSWETPFPDMPFGGQMCSESAYMPWWGQVRPGTGGYIAIVDQPWDASYAVSHPAPGPTSVGIGWLPSLGRMDYQRTMRFVFRDKCDYNDLCKIYRGYAEEHGLLVTLEEKAAKLSHVNRLIGSAVVHLGTKTSVKPGGRYYNAEEPEKNERLIPFSVRTAQMKKLAADGVKKAYLHLDGWGQPGYDNQHPDYLPAGEEAGGWEGLKELADTCRSNGFLFGLHDQYRDYYLDASSYDPNMAVHLADGTLYEHTIWAGGTQNYLCPSQQPLYVKRNFEEVLSHGIHLDATYLDVFTCNEPDECSHPWHRVTRKECLEYRARCFDYLLSRGILSSSEEVVDWAIPSQVFCHWAPYAKPEAGIPVPLLNLVYHDCVIIPWMLGKGEWGTPEGQLGYLHAMLNGGIGYIDPELAEDSYRDNLEKAAEVGALSEKVGKQELLRHEFLSKDYSVQRTTFADGTTVTVDFSKETCEVSHRA